MDEIKDKELDDLLDERVKEQAKQMAAQQSVVPVPETKETKNEVMLGDKVARSSFADKMDDVKINVLAEASTEDHTFVNTIKQNLKKAAVTHTEVEKDKAELEKQHVQSESEKVTKEQKKTEHEIKEDKWDNAQKQRQFVYDGLKPILTFAGIDTPFSCWLMCFFALFLIVPYFINKLWNGTVGVIIFGACDKDRSKAMKGVFWTLLVLILLFAIFAVIYFFLKGQGIDILHKFK